MGSMGKEVVKHRLAGLDGRTKRHIDLLRRLMERGKTPLEIADEMSQGDEKKRNRIFNRISRLIDGDPELQSIVGSLGKGQLIAATPEMASALVRRATKGNVPAIKL